MRIDINQKKISIGDKYKIFIDERETYSASSELFRLLAVINLFENENSQARLTIKKLWSFFKAKYDIQLYDNNKLEFRTRSVWKLHYQCQSGKDLFNIYGHRGRKYSIFKNDQQVAWWNKEAVTWFAGDNYKITADNDCDIELIIAFCLIIDNFSSSNHDGNAMTLDMGNIGWQAKKFNPDWMPSEKTKRLIK